MSEPRQVHPTSGAEQARIDETYRSMRLLAALASLIVPGAGHVLLGRPRRGLL